MKITVAAVVASLVCFIIGNIWIFVGADMFGSYFYEARMVALTHVFTLGIRNMFIDPELLNVVLYAMYWDCLFVFTRSLLRALPFFDLRGQHGLQEQSDLYWESYGWDSECVWL
jgi:hypothetical protein